MPFSGFCVSGFSGGSTFGGPKRSLSGYCVNKNGSFWGPGAHFWSNSLLNLRDFETLVGYLVKSCFSSAMLYKMVQKGHFLVTVLMKIGFNN